MGRLYIALLCMAVVLGFAVKGAHNSRAAVMPPLYTPQTTGYDVSWPNCEASVPKDTAWGVVGVTGGLVFRKNPCLKQQAAWFRTPALYVNTGYAGIEKARHYASAPHTCGVNDEQCLAYNYGYQSGVYAVKQATAHGLYARMWWLDVETENSWSDNTAVNRRSLQGVADAIRHDTVGSAIGYYSYPGQWDRITGAWHNGAPAWAATGTSSRLEAIAACKAPGFTGGRVWFTQYVTTLDRNYAC